MSPGVIEVVGIGEGASHNNHSRSMPSQGETKLPPAGSDHHVGSGIVTYGTSPLDGRYCARFAPLLLDVPSITVPPGVPDTVWQAR